MTTVPTARQQPLCLRAPASTSYVGLNYVDKGYMTNYAAGYHLVRQNPKTSYDKAVDNSIHANGGLCIQPDGTTYDRVATGAFKELGGTAGPIQLATLDKSRFRLLSSASLVMRALETSTKPSWPLLFQT